MRGRVTGLLGVVLLAAVTVGSPPAAHAAAVGPDGTCPTHLPTWVDGVPPVAATSMTGLYLGHDVIVNGEHGYLLRVSGARVPTVYRVSVRIERTIHVRRFPALRGDGWAVSADGHTLQLRLAPTRAHLDGVDFTTDCAVTMSVAASLNGAPLHATQVFYGAHRARQAAFPVVLRRG